MKKILLIFILLLISVSAFGRNGDVSLNEYYAYPISGGFYYHQMSDLGSDTLSKFNINQLSGEIRFPIPGPPELQVLAVGGFSGYDYTGDSIRRAKPTPAFCRDAVILC